MPSSGLHTNGYTLARAALLKEGGLAITDKPAELGGLTVADALLAVHRSYLNDLRSVWSTCGRASVHGLAHITGGGFYDNIPRVVPEGLCVEVDPTTWSQPPLFQLIAAKGSVTEREMYRVFNMGIGMVVITSPEVDLGQLKGLGATEIGQVSRGPDKVRLPF